MWPVSHPQCKLGITAGNLVPVVNVFASSSMQVYGSTSFLKRKHLLKCICFILLMSISKKKKKKPRLQDCTWKLTEYMDCAVALTFFSASQVQNLEKWGISIWFRLQRLIYLQWKLCSWFLQLMCLALFNMWTFLYACGAFTLNLDLTLDLTLKWEVRGVILYKCTSS